MSHVAFETAVDDIRKRAFGPNHIMGWNKSDDSITIEVVSILEKAGIEYILFDYKVFGEPEHVALFVKAPGTGDFVRVNKDPDHVCLARTASFQYGTLLAIGKRGTKLPIRIVFKGRLYVGDSYWTESVTMFSPVNESNDIDATLSDID